MRGVARDFRSVGRRLVRHPAAVLTPVSVTAFGLAACMVVYTILDHFFIKPLPFADADRLATISTVAAAESGGPGQSAAAGDTVSVGGLEALARSGAFAEIGGWFPHPYYFGYPATDVVTVWNTPSTLLGVLGLAPAKGRFFTRSEDSSRTDVAVISWECWQRRYGGREDILDQTVTLTDSVTAGAAPEVRRIIGVLPRGFGLRGAPPDVLQSAGRFAPGAGIFYLVARLPPGLSLQAARDLATLIVTATDGAGVVAQVRSLRDDVMSGVAPPAGLLIAVAALLLVVTGTSACGLVLHDHLQRRRESGIRLYLGATHASIRRELIVEHVLRSALALVVAVTVAWLLVGAIGATVPPELMGGHPPRIDGRVLTWSLGGALLVNLLLGVLPAMLMAIAPASPAALGHALPERLRGQKIIATLQLATSFVLLVAAGLLGQTLGNLTSRPIGFDPSHLTVLAYKTSTTPTVAPNPAQDGYYGSWRHTEGLLNALTRLPGVKSAAAVSAAPFSGSGRPVRVGFEASGGRREVGAQILAVTKDYWQTLGLRITPGRGLEDSERPARIGQPYVSNVVISAELDRLVGGHSVGTFLQRGNSRVHVVGVVENAKQRSFADPDLPVIYALSTAYLSVGQVIVRTTSDSGDLIPVFRRTILDYDPSILITQATTMTDLVSTSVAAERFRMSLGTALGAIALTLSAVGVFLLGSRFVTMRRREIGVRLALGASSPALIGLVLKEVAQCGVASLVVGGPASLMVAGLLRNQLFGVSPADPAALLLAVAVLVAATAMAMLGPLRLALKTDPAICLRD